MMVHPNEDSIADVMEFTACDRNTAVTFLKGNNNDVQQALNAIFNDPDPKRYENSNNWDESAWSADRHGGNELKVVNPEWDAGENNTGVAPSRPPSRAHQAQSQIEQAPPDYGTVHATWNTQKPREDFEGVDEAIQRSLQDQGLSGVKRDLVGREIVPDVDPHARERRPDEPAFLKPLTNGDFLPALLVILHEIPSCRNALLGLGRVLDDHGYSESWWTGDDIPPMTIQYQADSEGRAEPLPSPVPLLLAETQRLTAFLGATERAYGSTESLARICSNDSQSRPQNNGTSLLQRFLEDWDEVSPSHPMFSFGVFEELKDSSSTLSHLRISDVVSNSIPLPKSATSFSAVLDETLWEKRASGQYNFLYSLESLPGILVVDMCEHTGHVVDIPTTLGLGRYMLSNRSKLEDMQAKNAVYLEEVSRIDSLLKRIREHKFANVQGTTITQNALAMLKRSYQYVRSGQEHRQSPGQAMRVDDAVRKLENVLAKVEARVDALSKEREVAQAAIETVSQLVVESDRSEAARNPEETCSRYILKGVANSGYQHFEVYIPSYETEKTTPPTPPRWWRLAYDTRKATPEITKELINESHVLSLASKGLTPTLLIYANAHRLLPTPDLPIPAPLQAFVATDNANFADELKSAATVPIVLDAEAMQGVSSSEETLGEGSRRGSGGSSTKVELSDGEGEGQDVREGGRGQEMMQVGRGG